jgi:SpoVK/Ycf46/Vps4 family AAA+-type ATPase
MTQSKYIKDIAKYGLENDQERLLKTLNELIDHSKKTRKTNFALQLQSLLKESLRQSTNSGLALHGSKKYFSREEDREVNDLILEKLTSDYKFENLVCENIIREELEYFVQEHKQIEILREFDLPVSNKLLFHGPSGCGKTLAAYVLAGELNKLMIVINLGGIVSSKLGETSKNLTKIFKRAATEDCIIFLDEFDSLGKIRDYSQDHGEMKRVVNTILQLFDYLPQDNIIIAATNHSEMIDDALMRRFDLQVKLELPDEAHIKEIIDKTLDSGVFSFDNKRNLTKIIKECQGLSYYTIQKTLITTIKRSLLSISKPVGKIHKIDTKLWMSLIEKEQIQKSSN